MTNRKNGILYVAVDDLREARQRESNIKHWPRAWKGRLIQRDNPNWDDLYDRLA